MRIVSDAFNLIDIRLPTGSDEEMAFRTFTNYLQAFRNWAVACYPHEQGLVAGLADEIKARPWRTRTTAGSARLGPSAARALRIAWGTELCLSVPSVVGGDAVSIGNLWAPAQAYYAAYHAIRAMEMVTSQGDGPATHAAVLRVASAEVAKPTTPFVVPWTARALGSEDGFRFEGFGDVAVDPSISNLSSPTTANAPHLVAKALKTTRKQQIEERHERWCSAMKTASGQKRRRLPRAIRIANSEKMTATTLFDFLWRLRTRTNYQEGDAFLGGPLGVDDAASFQSALAEIVAATLLTAEVYLAHLVGGRELRRCLEGLTIPSDLATRSIQSRIELW